MKLILFAGPASQALAAGIAHRLGTAAGSCHFERFPDSEFHLALGESVRGADVYLIQSTSPPADEHLMELLQLADACRRAGAARVTAVVPYFAYARQDRRASGREPVSGRLVADLIGTSGVARVVAVDLHTAALEGFFPVPLEHLSAVPRLAGAIRPWLPEHAVVVAPDLGAVKLAERYAALLDRPVAIVHKTRLTAEEVRVERVVGEVRDRSPIIVDDMISTGGTIAAAATALLAAGSRPAMIVVASHALLVGPAVARLGAAPITALVATDSVELPAPPALPLHAAGLAPLLAEAIERLHADQSLADLLAHH